MARGGRGVGGGRGVAVGAWGWRIPSLAQGHADIVTADFAPAFGAVALVSAASLFFHAALPPGAGAEVSGHGRGREAPGSSARAQKTPPGPTERCAPPRPPPPNAGPPR